MFIPYKQVKYEWSLKRYLIPWCSNRFSKSVCTDRWKDGQMFSFTSVRAANHVFVRWNLVSICRLVHICVKCNFSGAPPSCPSVCPSKNGTLWVASPDCPSLVCPKCGFMGCNPQLFIYLVAFVGCSSAIYRGWIEFVVYIACKLCSQILEPHDSDMLPSVSKIKIILSFILYSVYGAVHLQLTQFACDDHENVYFILLSSSNWRYESLTIV